MGLVVNEPIHPWRWRALTVWVVVFTVVGYELLLRPFIDNHEATGRCPIPRHLIIKTRPLRGVN
jgi:hypothetical protein